MRLCLLLLAALLTEATSAYADQPSPIEADPPAPKPIDPAALEERATREKAEFAMSQGRIDEACVLLDTLTKSEQPLALIDAGQCYALAGKSASAYKRYTRASIAAASRGETSLEDRARDLAGKLVPSLSKLRVDVMAATADLAVTLNGVPFPKSEWGVLAHVDPGPIALRATADGKSPFETSVVVGPNGDAQVIVVPLLKAPSIQPPGHEKLEPRPSPPAETTSRVSPIGIAAFLTTAFGVVGVGTGIAFGVMTLSEVGEAEENPALCPGKICSEAGRAVIDEAETKGIVSTAMFAIGGASLATGATLFLLREFGVIDTAPAQAPSPLPRVSVTPVSLGATWRFD